LFQRITDREVTTYTLSEITHRSYVSKEDESRDYYKHNFTKHQLVGAVSLVLVFLVHKVLTCLKGSLLVQLFFFCKFHGFFRPFFFPMVGVWVDYEGCGMGYEGSRVLNRPIGCE
jgi:hypothetical protein